MAIGGNALVREGQRGSIAEQAENARSMASQVAAVLSDGQRLVLTHGNGPQVGFILLRSELAANSPLVPQLSLDMCVADSQGGIGYILLSALENALSRDGAPGVICLLTRTVVDRDDPAFAAPTKPIGPWFTAEEARQRQAANGWVVGEDAGRGYRRLVASPHPRKILELQAIGSLVASGFVVVALGGGGIPVVEEGPGTYIGIEAVIDKDLASALLAAQLGAETLILSTGVDRVAIHYRQPDESQLEEVKLSRLRDYYAAGEFPPGSMGPKVQAAIEFLEMGGRQAIITSLFNLRHALAGNAGTRILPD